MFESLRGRRSQAEALLRGLLDAAGVGLCVLDDDARVVLANEAWLHAFGLTAEAAAGRDLRELFLPPSISLVHALEEARAGRAVDLPLHRQVSETAESWIEGRLAPLALEHGPGLLHTALDVTKRKRTSDALYKSEGELRISLANATIGFARATPAGRFLEVNPAYCAITGFTMEELRCKAALDLSHPDDRPELERRLGRMLRGEIQDFVIECRIVRKDGGLAWARKSFSVVRSSGGAPQWIISLVEDVTERRRAELALRESEERVSAICEHAPVGVALLQLPGNVYVKVNEAFLRLHDVRREDVLGRTADEIALIEASERARVLEAIARDGSVHGFMIRKRTRGGEERLLSVDVDPLDVGGKPFLLAMVQDRGPVPPA